MNINYKTISKLLGISKTTYYEWIKNNEHDKIFKFLNKYFNENQIKQFVLEEKINELDIYNEWKRTSNTRKIKLRKKIYDICINKNQLENYDFIDFIMNLFLEFEQSKKEEYSKNEEYYDEKGFISYIMTFKDYYNIYLFKYNKKDFFKLDDKDAFSQHRQLIKLKNLTNISDDDSIQLLDTIFKDFDDLLLIPNEQNINEEKGIGIIKLIYHVYSEMKKRKWTAKQKIEYAVNDEFLEKLLKTTSSGKVWKLVEEQEEKIKHKILEEFYA